MPPTPKKRGAATSDGTGGASGKECFLPVPRGIFLRLACSWERFEEREQCGSNEGLHRFHPLGGIDCAANTLQKREGRDAFGSGH